MSVAGRCHVSNAQDGNIDAYGYEPGNGALTQSARPMQQTGHANGVSPTKNSLRRRTLAASARIELPSIHEQQADTAAAPLRTACLCFDRSRGRFLSPPLQWRQGAVTQSVKTGSLRRSDWSFTGHRAFDPA